MRLDTNTSPVPTAHEIPETSSDESADTSSDRDPLPETNLGPFASAKPSALASADPAAFALADDIDASDARPIVLRGVLATELQRARVDIPDDNVWRCRPVRPVEGL